MHVTREEFLQLFGQALNGAMANPANGYTIWDSYQRQQLMQGLVADLLLVVPMIPEEEIEND